MSQFIDISRRRLLGASAAMGVLGAFPLLGAKAARAAEPKRGGHLKLALDGGSTARGLDPATYAQAFDAVSGLQMFNTLIELNDAGLPEASLATEWLSDDLVTWVIKLRQGVTFHNGKTLSPADVVYSLNHHRGEQSKSAARSLVSAFADVKVGAPDEVIITLSQPNADLPAILTDYHMCITAEGEDWNKAIGTGAFVLEDYQAGTRTLSRRNENYWRSDRGFVDSVESISINDATARISALRTGAVDMINRVDAKVAKMLQNDPSLVVHATPGTGFYTVSMRTDQGPFASNDLRLALKHAMDREAMINVGMNGFGTIGNDNPIAASDPYHHDLPAHSYDPDKVKFHLKKSGFEGRIQVQCPVHQTNVLDAGQVLQQSANEAGFPLDFVRIPTDGYMENVFKKADCFTVYWNGRPTPDMMFSQAFKSDAAWNASSWANESFDKLLVEARGQRDETLRKEMYGEMQRLIHDEGGEAIWAFFTFLDGTSKRVQGYAPTSFAELSGQRAPEKVWLEG